MGPRKLLTTSVKGEPLAREVAEQQGVGVTHAQARSPSANLCSFDVMLSLDAIGFVCSTFFNEKGIDVGSTSFFCLLRVIRDAKRRRASRRKLLLLYFVSNCF